MNVITTILASAVLSLCATADGAVLKVVPVSHNGEGPGLYMVSAISASPAEFITRRQTLSNNSYVLALFHATDGRIVCSRVLNGNVIRCTEGASGTLAVGAATPCVTASDAAANMSQFIGLTNYHRIGRPISWEYFCTSGHTMNQLTNNPVVPDNPPASCTANTALLTLRGKVGERLKETTDLQIHCDLPANIRLSMPNGGLVSVGGEGEVLLTFQTNGSDVLNVSGTDPVVSLDGELTKSPTTAGTYRGSTVLRLDIL